MNHSHHWQLDDTDSGVCECGAVRQWKRIIYNDNPLGPPVIEGPIPLAVAAKWKAPPEPTEITEMVVCPKCGFLYPQPADSKLPYCIGCASRAPNAAVKRLGIESSDGTRARQWKRVIYGDNLTA